MKSAIGKKETTIFHSSLALLELRANDFKRESEILSTLPDNVIPLDLIRQHVEAAQHHDETAAKLASALNARQEKMNFGEFRVFNLVRNGFGLGAADIVRQPLPSELDEIFDTEIEL